MDQPVPMRRPLSALAEAAAAQLELAIVEEIGPLVALEYVVEEIQPAVGMQPCLVRNRRRRRVPRHCGHVVNG
jgi:hypothetical protein